MPIIDPRTLARPRALASARRLASFAVICLVAGAVSPSFSQQADTPLEGMDGQQPSDRRPTSPPKPPPAKKPTVAPTPASTDLKEHRFPADGFVVSLPRHWVAVPIRGAVKINYRGGLDSCNVNIIPNKFPGSNGRPRLLNGYLASVTRANVTSQIPATMRPRVISVENGTLGGQPARRIVMDIFASGRNLRMVQNLTFRTNGVYTLTCGAPQATFDDEKTQVTFAKVHKSFRFIGN